MRYKRDMFLAAILGLTLLAQNACAGSDLKITSVKVESASQDAGNTIYHLLGTVENVGTTKEASNFLQFVDVYISGTGKVDSRGVPPLGPGQKYNFGYDFKRSSDAGAGSSELRFQLDFREPDCNMEDSAFRLRV